MSKIYYKSNPPKRPQNAQNGRFWVVLGRFGAFLGVLGRFLGVFGRLGCAKLTPLFFDLDLNDLSALAGKITD